jgi:hypothetical protein
LQAHLLLPRFILMELGKSKRACKPKVNKKFLKMLQHTTKKQKTIIQQTVQRFVCVTVSHSWTVATETDDRSTAPNSGFNKCGLTRVNQVQFFNQTFVQVDSLSLRNPALLKATNRQSV